MVAQPGEQTEKATVYLQKLNEISRRKRLGEAWGALPLEFEVWGCLVTPVCPPVTSKGEQNRTALPCTAKPTNGAWEPGRPHPRRSAGWKRQKPSGSGSLSDVIGKAFLV